MLEKKTWKEFHWISPISNLSFLRYNKVIKVIKAKT